MNGGTDESFGFVVGEGWTGSRLYRRAGKSEIQGGVLGFRPGTRSRRTSVQSELGGPLTPPELEE